MWALCRPYVHNVGTTYVHNVGTTYVGAQCGYNLCRPYVGTYVGPMCTMWVQHMWVGTMWVQHM